MSLLTTPSTVHEPRARLHQLGLPRRRPAAGLRHSARRGAGDISIYQEVASGLQEGFPAAAGPIRRTPHVVWAYPLLGTYNTTALVYGDIYYTLLDRGFLLAHDAATGEEIYGRRRLEIGNGFTASPWGYNGKVSSC